MNRLAKQYHTKISPALQSELGSKNVMQIPKISKIVVNAGIGRILQTDPKRLDDLVENLARITGQRPVKTVAKKAISAFKIRDGQVVGLSVTLRGNRMYDFFDKLVNVALPRTRDFRGLSRKGFDGHGNYSLGIRDHIIFPEMAQDEMTGGFGLEVVIVTTAADNDQGYALLKKSGFPFND